MCGCACSSIFLFLFICVVVAVGWLGLLFAFVILFGRLHLCFGLWGFVFCLLCGVGGFGCGWAGCTLFLLFGLGFASLHTVSSIFVCLGFVLLLCVVVYLLYSVWVLAYVFFIVCFSVVDVGLFSVSVCCFCC